MTRSLHFLRLTKSKISKLNVPYKNQHQGFNTQSLERRFFNILIDKLLIIFLY